MKQWYLELHFLEQTIPISLKSKESISMMALIFKFLPFSKILIQISVNLIKDISLEMLLYSKKKADMD
jgi:hypothetical protein